MGKIETYAAYMKDSRIRDQSSSGGVFSAIAGWFIDKGGSVYGVSMSQDGYRAEYICVQNKRELYKLRGSKYLQAIVGDTFLKVKDELNAGRRVLFTGTGCQVNGLKLFLGKKYDNLLTVDVICHGTPSQLLWEKYLKNIEKRHDMKVNRVNFRCKEKSWRSFSIKMNDKKKKMLRISKDVDSYMQMFLQNYSLRPSCYHCGAVKLKMSDMSIADFWGIEKVLPDFDDKKGISLVILRTDTGKKCFENIKDKLRYKEVLYEEGVQYNPCEYMSVPKPYMRDQFYKDMNRLTISQLERKYLYCTWKSRMKHLYKCVVGKSSRGGYKR